MELTIEQALQQGVAAQNAGNLQEAERLYRSVLQTQPAHPDANHNLGLIAVSVNKGKAALLLFKTALEANPKIDQFWHSYLKTLIQENHLETAQAVLDVGKKQGLAGEKVDALEAQLKRIAYSSPSKQQLSSLLGLYQNGQLAEAESLANSFTKKFPEHQFSWKMLGILLGQTGRKSEALHANQKAVQLSPQDAEAHSNLGNVLRELGRFEEAELSCRQAIALNPDVAEAHNDLGVMLRELGRFEEAEACYRQAIELQPNFAQAHNSLGGTLREQGRLEEAEASYRQAITLEPSFALAHSNLSVTLKDLGRLEEAEASCRHAIALQPDFTEARYNLGVLLFESKQYNLAAEQFKLVDIHQSKFYAIKCSYHQDEESIFSEKLDLLIDQGENNAVIGSLSCCSESKYGTKKTNPFCNDPLKYVQKTDLNELYDFENIFIKAAKDILADSSVSHRAQVHLTNGLQTAGNIFGLGKVADTEIERIIRAEIDKYGIRFKDSPEGFIKNWPTSYSISGWLVSMQSGGKLTAHMHDTGWITGSVYINVPPKSKADSGNLVLCLSDQEHVSEAENSQTSIIDVVTGNLCLFPSSLHHYTIPFDEEENRIVLAFDVIPSN